MASEWNAGVAAKWQTANKWTPEGVPTASTDVTLTAAHAGECSIENAERFCRSLVMTGYTGTLKLFGFRLKVGTSTAQAENVAAKFAGTISGAALSIDFVSTFTTTAQTIWGGGVTVGTPLRFTAAGKWKLEENLTVSETLPVKQEAGTLELNGKTVDAGNVEIAGTSTLDATNATIKVREAGSVFVVAEGVTLTSTGSTVEVLNTGATEKTFAGGKQTYNKITLSGRNVKVEGANKYKGTLNLGNSASKPEAAQGTKLVKSVKQTLEHATVPLEFSGKAGELSRLESTEAAKAAELEWTVGTGDYEPTNSFVAVKDITWSKGVLYLPNGKDEGGNTNIKFEAKPSGATAFAATASISVNATSTSKMLAATNAKPAIRLSATATDRMVAATKTTAATNLSSNAQLRMLQALTAKSSVNLTGQVTDKMLQAVAAKAGITIGAAATFRVVTIGGKKVLIMILED